MSTSKKVERFKRLIERQRTSPKIWDFSYVMLKNNLNIFKKFRNLVLNENKTKILDVGCGFKPYLKLFDKNKVEYIGVDFEKDTSDADFIASAEKFPFSDNSFDALIYSEVLEHIKDLNLALSEMKRVSKNGTLIFISSPFIFPEHGIPYDFQRLTQYFYKEKFKYDEIIEISPSNTSFSTPFVVFNLFIQSSPFKIFYFLKDLIFIINNTLAIIIDNIIKFLVSKLFKNYKRIFYSMPVGYALIIRIKK
ncbi:MAG: class I SAM-dependent methyltransferase [Candidatus Omnitrophica bacterium]|nr:class I SAM-dependent methyltransferase [Candidatus Omnitrophota bacterium]